MRYLAFLFLHCFLLIQPSVCTAPLCAPLCVYSENAVSHFATRNALLESAVHCEAANRKINKNPRPLNSKLYS